MTSSPSSLTEADSPLARKERSMGPRTFHPTAVSLSEPSECSVGKMPRGELSLSAEAECLSLCPYDTTLLPTCQGMIPYRHGKETQGKNTSPHRTRSRGHSHAEGVLWPYLRERGHPHGTADGSARDAKDDSLLPCPKEGVRLS